jgi:hypothetical protein
MSTFRTCDCPCPACGVVVSRSIARVLNVARSPAVVAEIRAGTFQRFTCGACGEVNAVDVDMVLLDLEQRFFVGMYPREAEPEWRSLEEHPLELWRSTMVESAPAIIWDKTLGCRVRTVFGLEALQEKLLCFERGLDDAMLEVLKLDLARNGVLHPAHRPRRAAVDESVLTFRWLDQSVPVPRANLDAIELQPVPWAVALSAVGAGPYVDVGRIMLA